MSKGIVLVDPADELEWALGLNRLSLHAMGLWPRSDTPEKSSLFRRSRRVPLMIIIMIFGMFLPELYAFILVIHEFQLAIDNFVTLSPTFTSCMKLYFMWKNRQALQIVVDSACDDWLRTMRPDWQLQIMREYAARARLVTIVDSVILLLCYLGYVCSAFLSFDIRVINNVTDYGDRYLMLQSYYPFDYSKSPRFELAMFFQQLSSFFVGLAIIVPDDYFVALVLHTSAQYRILGAQMRLAIGRQITQPQITHRLLVGFVERHVHLHSMLTVIERSFSFVIAAQIVCMCSVVCCLGFETNQILNDTSAKPALLQILTLAGTLFTMLAHTLVDCCASESLASSTEQLFFSIQASKWSSMEPCNLRCLIPMLMMSQKPRKIKAGKFLPLSMETYCIIVKTILGYMSVLVAVSSR